MELTLDRPPAFVENSNSGGSDTRATRLRAGRTAAVNNLTTATHPIAADLFIAGSPAGWALRQFGGLARQMLARWLALTSMSRCRTLSGFLEVGCVRRAFEQHQLFARRRPCVWSRCGASPGATWSRRPCAITVGTVRRGMGIEMLGGVAGELGLSHD